MFASEFSFHFSSRSQLLLYGLLCLTLLSIGLSGCSDNSDDEAPSGEEAEHETLPDDFPSEVPIYQPSKVSSVSNSSVEGVAIRYVVGFTTDASKEDVAAFYLQELTSNGWTSSATEGDTRFSAENGDTSVVFGVTSAFGQTIFTITAQKLVDD